MTFDPGERSTDAIAAELEGAVEDPETFRRDGNLVWKAREQVDADRLDDLGVGASRALVIRANDTSMAGGGTLYERVDGAYVPVDKMAGGEGYVGRDVVYYVQREHGLAGADR